MSYKQNYTGKSDCIDGMLYNNLKNGIPRLNICISLLCTEMLVHGIAPVGMLLSTLVPIPKNKRGNKSDSSNYRAIAISSLLGKIFHIIVLTEQCKNLETDNLPFGFKKNIHPLLFVQRYYFKILSIIRKW